MKTAKFHTWNKRLAEVSHLIIAGPCSAETEEQVISTALEIAKIPDVKVFRAGIWKPRTTPGSFEGVGKAGLKWLEKVKQQTNLLTCTEVATPEHIEAVFNAPGSVDLLWIGARTSASPFAVQEIANALKGVDIPVLVKNPVVPDMKLWIGAIERLLKAGITKIAAIHRGFYPFEKTRFRNIPKWELLVNLKMQLPDIQIIGDPSHISGDRRYIEEVVNMFLCLNIDGLMIETHINPQEALSDAEQQLTPSELKKLLSKINFRKSAFDDKKILSKLEELRFGIDSIDTQLLELLAQRMKIVEQIGEFKNQNNISIFQVERWREIVKTRLKIGKQLNLNPSLTKKIMQLIHEESIELQSKLQKDK